MPLRNPSHLVPRGMSMAGAFIRQLWDTMSLRTADLGLVGVTRAACLGKSNTPTEPPFISSSRVSALESSTPSENRMLSLQSFLRKGVSLGYVELHQNQKNQRPTTFKDPSGSYKSALSEGGVVGVFEGSMFFRATPQKC